MQDAGWVAKPDGDCKRLEININQLEEDGGTGGSLGDTQENTRQPMHWRRRDELEAARPD